VTDGGTPIREGLLFTQNAGLAEQISRTVLHWPLEILVRDSWKGWEGVSPDCRLLLIDRGTIPSVDLSDRHFRIILCGEGEALLEALTEFLYLREPLSQAVGIEHLLHTKCRQYLKAVSSLKESDSAYSFFSDLLDRMLIPTALDVTEGNQHKASRILGISRTTFRSKMKSITEGERGPENGDCC
jgi:DNA-binding protein Fis